MSITGETHHRRGVQSHDCLPLEASRIYRDSGLRRGRAATTSAKDVLSSRLLSPLGGSRELGRYMHGSGCWFTCPVRRALVRVPLRDVLRP